MPPEEDSTLKFHRARERESSTYRELETIAGKARLPSHLIVLTAKEAAEQFDALWHRKRRISPLEEKPCLPLVPGAGKGRDPIASD